MPAIRSPKNAALICSRLAEGWTLRQIAKELGCVNSAIVKWSFEDEEFGKQYMLAMQLRMDHYAEENIEIADDGSNDWMVREGITVPDHEHINRSRLRIDTRKWTMARLFPKRYGERVEIAGDLNVGIERRERVAKAIATVFAIAPPAMPADDADGDGVVVQGKTRTRSQARPGAP